MVVAQAQQNAPQQLGVAAAEEKECAAFGPMRIEELEVCLLLVCDSFVRATASAAHVPVQGVFGRALASTGTIWLRSPISECKIDRAVTDS